MQYTDFEPALPKEFDGDRIMIGVQPIKTVLVKRLNRSATVSNYRGPEAYSKI